MSEVTSSWTPGDYHFDDAVHVPSSPESSSLISAQSGQGGKQLAANPIATAAKAAADVVAEIAGPTAKVWALASASMAEGANANGLQISLFTTASLERMLALSLSIGVLLWLGFYEFMISRPARRTKAIKEAERLLQVSRASTSFKLPWRTRGHISTLSLQ